MGAQVSQCEIDTKLKSDGDVLIIHTLCFEQELLHRHLWN